MKALLTLALLFATVAQAAPAPSAPAEKLPTRKEVMKAVKSNVMVAAFLAKERKDKTVCTGELYKFNAKSGEFAASINCNGGSGDEEYSDMLDVSGEYVGDGAIISLTIKFQIAD